MNITESDIRTLIKEGKDKELCFLLLYRVLEEGAYSNLVLKQADRYAHETGGSIARVRAFLYGTVTYLYSIDFLIKHITKKDCDMMNPEVRTVIRLGAWEILFSKATPDYAACSTSVELIKRYRPEAAGFVNAILRKLAAAPAETKDINNYKPEIVTSLKPEIFGLLKKAYGREGALSIGKAFLVPSKISIRFDPGKISKETLRIELETEGFEVAESDFIPGSLKLLSGLNGLQSSELFKRGVFFVQSEAAMLAGLIAAPEAGMKILDCCAAPGGKSTHMAEICGDDCSILSTDISESRLSLIEENIKRLGLRSIKTKQMDATDMKELEDRSFDLVVADVPCSGLGLLGRKPDIREQISYNGIMDLLPVQAAILSEASSKVKAGGALVYCTCTLNPDENRGQVDRFLSEHDNFEICDISGLVPPELIIDDERKAGLISGNITLRPDIDGTDGFYICKMIRRR